MLQCSGVTCSELRAALPSARRVGDCGEAPLTGLAHHSRQVGEGVAFFALAGARADGSEFIAQAFAAGAPIVVSEREVVVPPGRELLVVPSARQAMADAATHLSTELLARMTLVGVTGTNGKTTTTYMIRRISEAAGIAAAAVGTTGVVGPDGTVTRLENTTPDILFLLQLFTELDAAGCRHVALEVSSQGVVQRRVAGIPFRVGVFTNLTPEHLETHGSFEAYHQAKLAFFREAAPAALKFGTPFVGVVNGEAPVAASFVEACPGPPFLFGSSLTCDVRASEVELRPDGTRFFLTGPGCNRWVDLVLPGRHNVQNALAAAAVGFALGLTPMTIADGLSALTSVHGRLERVPGTSRRVFVDYAHTSDGLKTLLESCREMLIGRPGELLVVFGCGGDRDRTKRPRMGRAAAELADRVWITSDNPRSEVPGAIIEEILQGVPAELRHKVTVDADRRRAIEAAVRAAAPDAMVVVAGKGHEDYQIVGDRVFDFDDVAEAARVIEELDHAADS